MRGSSGSDGWPSKQQRPESASYTTAHRVGERRARPASAPVLHLDLHRFAPSATSKPYVEPPPAPAAAHRERTMRPQSAPFKQKTTLSFAASGARPSSAQLASLGCTSDADKQLHRASDQRVADQEAARRAADADDHRFSRFGPKKSNIPTTDRWLEMSQAPRHPVERDVARKYAHGSRESSGSHSSFFRGWATPLSLSDTP